MVPLGRAVVLYNDVPDNAANDDLDVLLQVEAVSYTLVQLGFEVSTRRFSLDDTFSAALLNSDAGFVFNLVESVSSEGRWSYLAPALLERLGIQYTGCSADSIRLTANKILTKTVLKHLGIPTPPWASIDDSDGFVPDRTYIVKSLYEDASVGLGDESVVSFPSLGDAKHLLRRMKAESGREFFAERFVDGREFSISILEENGKPRILTPSEIRFVGYDERNKPKIVDYKAKWEPTSFEYQNTFAVHSFHHEDYALLARMRAISEKCWSFFGLRGYARIDFRVDKEGRPWVLEINANPCITPGESGFLKSAEESGLDLCDVVGRIIKVASGRDWPLPYVERCKAI